MECVLLEESAGTSQEIDSLKSDQCSSSSFQCKPPRKIHGLDVEIAVRKAPYQGYYPVKIQRVSEAKPKPWVPPKEEKPVIPAHKCLAKFYLERMYRILVQNADPRCEKIGNDVWSLWKSYEREGADVFVLSEMDTVANILLLFSLSCTHFSCYQTIFDLMIQRLLRGVYLGNVSKDLGESNKLSHLFSCLGVGIIEGHAHAQTCLSNLLSIWLEDLLNKGKANNRKYRCRVSSKIMERSKILSMKVPDHILLATLEKSLLTATVAKNIMRDMQIEVYISILSLLKLCCEASSKIRERLWCLPILDNVLSRLTDPDPSNRILMQTTDFVYALFGVYNMYQTEDKASVLVPKLTKDPFQTLLQRFIQQLGNPRSSAKSLLSIRNDTAFLICLIGERVPFSGEYFRRYGATIALLVANGILGIRENEDSFTLDEKPEDLELLQYMICMLKSIVESDRGGRIVGKFGLVAVLLTLILGPCSLLSAEEATPNGRDLQNAAWSTIQEIIKRFPLSLLTQHGASSLLNTLKTFGKAGEAINEATLAMSLHILRTLLTMTRFAENEQENEKICDEVILYFIERDAVAIFLNVLSRLVEYDNFGALQDSMISNALYCLARLGYCEYCDPCQKEIFRGLAGATMMSMIMLQLTRNIAWKTRSDSVVMIAVSECICGCIVHYPPALENFLECEGMLRILDVLEISTTPEATAQIMNCIVQLCDYPRCLHQLLSWKRPVQNGFQSYVFGNLVNRTAKSLLYTVKEAPKSEDNLLELGNSKDLSLAALLCSLWKNDEKRTEVLRDPEGCIASLSHPLMTKVAREFERGDEYLHEGTCYDAISSVQCKFSIDMKYSSLRPKIFVLIKRIVEATNTAATLFDGLSLNNQILMQVIINFMDLKASEVYTDLDDEIQRTGFSFAPDDEEEATALVMMARNKIETVLETQRYLLRRFKENECMKETEFYLLIKKCCLQNHLLAAREIDYIARSTNYSYLVERRLWQKQALESAAERLHMSMLEDSKLHRTSGGYLNITAWPGRTKRIVEVKEVEKDEEEEPIVYVDNEEDEFPEGETEVDLEVVDENEEEGEVELEIEDDLEVTLDIIEDYEATGENEENHEAREENEETLEATEDKGHEVDVEIGENYIEIKDSVVLSKLQPELNSNVASTTSSKSVVVEKGETPEHLEGGFYQVSPHLLRQALTKLRCFRSRNPWINFTQLDEENEWKTTKKWRRDWYPLHKGKLGINHKKR